MLQTIKAGLETTGPEDTEEQADETVASYARKTYRYLRIAIVSMTVMLLLCTLIQSLEAGAWLGSLSAYYYTPVHAIFIGSLVMIGICLIAIRGRTAPEEIILNLAGMCAPIVALVPTGFPDEPGYKHLFSDDLPIPAMQSNNVSALAVTAVFAVLLTFGIGSRGRLSVAFAALDDNARIGFGLATITVIVLAGLHAIGGSQWTHNGSAAILILGLWLVATINSVRGLRYDSKPATWGRRLQVGVYGSAVLLGATLIVVGLVRAVTGNGLLVLVGGVALVAAVEAGTAIFDRPRARTWFRPPPGDRDRWGHAYFAIAATMVVGGPMFGLWPGKFEHRTLWVELVELIPFGVFWVIQTIEQWDPPDATTELDFELL